MQHPQKVLLVEDDRNIANALRYALQKTYDLDMVTTGKAALYKVDGVQYDIVMLDLNLPDMSGAMVCQLLREQGLRVPILILTAESSTLTKIRLLDEGANDYLTKPFSLGELKARMRALTRTAHQPAKPARRLTVGDVELDRQTYEFRREGAVITLRRKEYAILEYLMEHAGSVVGRRALSRYAWHGAEDLWTNTIDVHIKHLRDKVDRPFGRPLIKTVHGIGYKFDPSQIITTNRD